MVRDGVTAELARDRAASRRKHASAFGATLAGLSEDPDLLVAVMARDLSSAYGYVRIAETYREVGRHDDALVWAERGVAAFSEHTDVRLREILAEEYQRRGRQEEAWTSCGSRRVQPPNAFWCRTAGSGTRIATTRCGWS